MELTEPTRLVVGPTPLVAAPRLAAALGICGRLLVKRDDLTGFALAGNKARTLEALVADAVATSATVLVTGGTAGSNFCQGAAATAAWAGIRCVLVLAGEPSRHPNLAAARSWGAEVQWTHDPDRAVVDRVLVEVAERLHLSGERPYVFPRGGATARGASGFHRAAQELDDQVDSKVGPVQIVVATGSGGTVAGLISGNVSLGRPWSVAGASVSRDPQAAAERVLSLARETSTLMGTLSPEPRDVHLVDARGPGHGVASHAGDAATSIALRAEGLVLDPVYTAKALACVNQVLGNRRDNPEQTTIFWHTGGLLDAVAGWEQHDD